MRLVAIGIIDTAPMPTLLIDGHNLLYATRPAFAAHLVDGHPGTAAREALIEWLLRSFTPPGPPVTLYFDGHEALTEARSARVEVIYSGGEGSQRADRAILKHLARLAATDPDAPVTVVTRDIQLARRVRKRGAAVVDPVEFCASRGLLRISAPCSTGAALR